MCASEVRVRAATRDDMPLVLNMIHELAEYEGMPEGPTLTVEGLIEDGFESNPPWFFALLAERVAGAEGAGGAGDAGGAVGAGGAGGVEPLGYALCNRAYSSWTRRALYVEDLYVRPHARRAGVGSLLLQRICQIALEAGANRVDWHVLESNAPALAFYQRCGARDLRRTEGRAALRLDRPHIERLAAPTPPHHHHHRDT